MRLTVATLAFTIAATGAQAQVAGAEMLMQCQQSRDDGRLLIANGSMLPKNWGFKILRYHPTEGDEFWTNGPCTIRLTKPLTGANRFNY